MRPFISLSRSREDDRLVGKRLVRVFIAPEENATNILPELFPWELPLPWAPFTVLMDTVVCPEPGDLARGFACAKDADASTSHDAGTSATAGTRNACGKSAAGKRLTARLNVVRMPASKPSMPRPKRSAVSAPRPRPMPLRTPKLRPRVVTQQKIFSAPLMRSTRLPRAPRDLAPQPGSLLLHRLPSGGSQRPGPRTQVALPRDFGWPQETRHRIPGRMPEPVPASADHRRQSATTATPTMTTPRRRAGRQLSRGFGRLF
jgi:hypothetical protein